MGIPTQQAGLQPAKIKQVGKNAAEQNGFEARPMPAPEHIRRREKLAAEQVPHSRVPEQARK